MFLLVAAGGLSLRWFGRLDLGQSRTATVRNVSRVRETRAGMLDAVHDVMEEVRGRTLRLVEHLDEEQLNAVLSPIMSPLSWDLGHVAAYEDLWLNHRAAGRPLLREDLAALYDAFETPRAVRGDLEFLRGGELASTCTRCANARSRRRWRRRAPRAGDPARAPAHRDDAAGDAARRRHASVVRRPGAVAGTGLEMVEVAEGPVEIGAPPEGFAYDNERPRHMASTGALHDRPHAGHQRHLAHVRRGRRL